MSCIFGSLHHEVFLYIRDRIEGRLLDCVYGSQRDEKMRFRDGLDQELGGIMDMGQKVVSGRKLLVFVIRFLRATGKLHMVNELDKVWKGDDILLPYGMVVERGFFSSVCWDGKKEYVRRTFGERSGRADCAFVILHWVRMMVEALWFVDGEFEWGGMTILFKDRVFDVNSGVVGKVEMGVGGRHRFIV